MLMVVGLGSCRYAGKVIPLRWACYILLNLTSGLYWELAGFMKQLPASWLSMPIPNGAQ